MRRKLFPVDSEHREDFHENLQSKGVSPIGGTHAVTLEKKGNIGFFDAPRSQNQNVKNQINPKRRIRQYLRKGDLRRIRFLLFSAFDRKIQELHDDENQSGDQKDRFVPGPFDEFSSDQRSEKVSDRSEYPRSGVQGVFFGRNFHRDSVLKRKECVVVQGENDRQRRKTDEIRNEAHEHHHDQLSEDQNADQKKIPFRLSGQFSVEKASRQTKQRNQSDQNSLFSFFNADRTEIKRQKRRKQRVGKETEKIDDVNFWNLFFHFLRRFSRKDILRQRRRSPRQPEKGRSIVFPER